MDEIAVVVVAGGGVSRPGVGKGSQGKAVEVFDRMRERRLVEPRRIIKNGCCGAGAYTFICDVRTSKSGNKGIEVS